MAVVLCGVAADSTNIRPTPAVDNDGKFEYIPIPEKGDSTETSTYGSLLQSNGDGTLADLITEYKTRKREPWVDDLQSIREQTVHHDPNLEQLTYGEHRPGYVSKLKELNEGDIAAFYSGFQTESSDYVHRYIIGYFTLADSPLVLDPDLSHEEKSELLEDHPENAHTKRFKAHGDLYYHDSGFISNPRDVIIVPGKKPGGRLGKAIKISDERRHGHYYMGQDFRTALNPKQGGKEGINLGGFKQAIHCDLSGSEFVEFIDSRL